MEKEDIENILIKLHEKRPIFHSEGDFQFSLGCEIQSMYPNIKIIIERPIYVERPVEDKTQSSGTKKVTEHIDMFLYDGPNRIGIELKFIKAKFSYKDDWGDYCLKPSLVNDFSCYDILKDIHRLENYAQIDKIIDFGYSITITNVSTLWEKHYDGSEYDQFRVFDGRKLHGTMDWPSKEVAEKKEYRSKPINLNGNYTVNWHGYPESPIEQQDKKQSNNTFKYVIFEIRNKP